MEDVLRQNNLSLLRDVERLRRSLQERSSTLPPEWLGYRTWSLSECTRLHQAVDRNLKDLSYGQASILPDVLSQTQAVTRAFFQFSRQASPVLRGLSVDRVALRVLLWMHLSHPETKDVPAAVSNEDFSIWPIVPPTYFLPCSVQEGLLYLPLFFHEFGHLLYALHHPEMDELVKSLQEQIVELLSPMSNLDDAMAAQVMLEQQIVVERWYEWMQEFFCDAVGVTIGGSSYVRAFSTYLRMSGRDQFQVPKLDLELQSHPVTWLRIRMMAAHLRTTGCADLADALEHEWTSIAGMMGVTEDYFGFYSDDFLAPVQSTLSDMLTEAGPVGLDSPVIDAPAAGGCQNPIPVLVEAWERFLASPTTYEDWEKEAIDSLLGEA